ncbi:MAG TPA: hypothetical protein VK327_12070 [Candidatus Paceibacterota bacterium]|nr:hypothetical protein [Candidatus Paceibacterota bacterium]
MLKLLQEMRGFSELNRLQPAAKPSPLFLMQVRNRNAEMRRPKQRLVITIDLQDVATIPTPVKITHLPQASGKTA